MWVSRKEFDKLRKDITGVKFRINVLEDLIKRRTTFVHHDKTGVYHVTTEYDVTIIVKMILEYLNLSICEIPEKITLQEKCDE
jgi:hypothetical protein